MISTATHGSVIPGYSFSNVRSRYQIKTLIDVSPTGIISEYRGDVPMPFVDDLKNIINDQESWSNSRNEQRNWETLVQCISLRAQPIMLSESAVENISVASLDFGYKGKQNVWTFDLGFETADIFTDSGDPVKLLIEQLDVIPILTGLKETAELTTNTIVTTGLKVNTLCYPVDL
ncbi:uncharacterized protein METZ01_LOCUS279084 [marine metagenome]|uniref:Uncharacterized protein n=1 Tax=marine metagenome TaxID=408172 RepID=A0A382KP49_9ZZZZ